MKSKIPFITIHLKHRKDREQNNKRCIKMAKENGFRIVNLDAMYGINDMRVNSFVDFTTDKWMLRNVLRKGEVGCFHSHYRAWKHGLESGVIVCEDDSILHDDCFKRLKKSITYLSEKEKSFLIHVFFCPPRSFNGACENIIVSDDLMRLKCPCYNTSCYYINNKACRILLNYISNKNIMPVDDLLSVVSSCHITKINCPKIVAYAFINDGLTRMNTPSDTET